MKFIKTDKHYMAEPDFEIDHYKDASYPPIASHYHESMKFISLSAEMRILLSTTKCSGSNRETC